MDNKDKPALLGILTAFYTAVILNKKGYPSTTNLSGRKDVFTKIASDAHELAECVWYVVREKYPSYFED